MKKSFKELCITEFSIAMRFGDMPFFGILMPFAVMALIGALLPPAERALAFAGVVTVGICASAFMGVPLTFAGYRSAGILKRFRVTPASPALLLCAVTAVQTLFALVSAILVYVLARFAFSVTVEGGMLRFVLSWALVLAAHYTFGFLVAALVPDIKRANIVCTILYFPMLLLSGATVPHEILPETLRKITAVMPLTQGIHILKGAVTASAMTDDLARIIVLAGAAVVSCILALVLFRWD